MLRVLCLYQIIKPRAALTWLRRFREGQGEWLGKGARHLGLRRTVNAEHLEHAARFFKGHLPEHIASLVAWESLRLVPGSFVKQSLQQAHGDLLGLRALAPATRCTSSTIFEATTTTPRAKGVITV